MRSMTVGALTHRPGPARVPVGAILTLLAAVAVVTGAGLLLRGSGSDQASAPAKVPVTTRALEAPIGPLYPHRTSLDDAARGRAAKRIPKPDPWFDVARPAAWQYGDSRLLARLAGQPASESAEGLLRRLRGLNPDAAAGISPREAEWARAALDALAREGAAAVPAIYRALRCAKDVPFGEGGAAVGAGSLRLGLIQTLGWIGGPEAEAVLVDQLGGTAEPAEVAAVADALDGLAPGYYREAVLTAVQETLTLVAHGAKALSPEPGEAAGAQAGYGKTDAAPLFELLQSYPQEEMAAELARLAPSFGQYAPVALGGLADGQGVPVLERMAAGKLEKPEGQLAMRMLAQMAPEEPAAQAALLERVRAGDIPESFWPMLADVVAGDHQLQITNPEEDGTQFGSRLKQNPYSTYTVSGRHVQRLYSVHRSGTLSVAEVNRRMDLIDRLYRETSDPVAMQALQQAEALLMGHGR